MPAAIWVELPSPFETAPGSILLADPPNISPRQLKALLLGERYPKPFAIDDGELVTLYFNIRLIQSTMRLESPNTLELRYTQMMMAFLLFCSEPKRIAVVGVGGGSLVKFCHRQLPQCEIVAVEADADVLAFRDIFKIPPDDARLRVLHGDGALYLSQTDSRFDAILVDAFDKTGVAPALASREFFEDCRMKLTPRGVLVVNLAGDKRRYRGLVECVAEVFDGRTLCVPVRGDGNSILFASCDVRSLPNWRRLDKTVKELQSLHNLDFPDLLKKMEKAAKSGSAVSR